MKSVFLKAIKGNIRREGIGDLLEWLGQTDFYTAPASSKYHDSRKGGLVKHSYNVWVQLKMLNEAFHAGLSEESMAIVALFHDLCKVDFYTESTKNVKNEKSGQWEKVPYYKIDEKFHFGGHGSKSLYLVMNFIKLTPEEAAAINCHMGPWDRQDYGKPGEVYETNMLAWLLHVADEAATYLLN